MSSKNASENRFLTATPGRLFIADALPMMLIMLMSGFLTYDPAPYRSRPHCGKTILYR